MGGELTKMQNKMEVEGKGGGSEAGWSDRGSIMSMMSKVSELEEELKKLKGAKGREGVMVLGGLQGYDGERWKAYVVQVYQQVQCITSPDHLMS